MPRIICKIPHEGVDYYLIYSTVSDSFSTYGVELEAFNRFMGRQEGYRYMEIDHPRRMQRVEEFGTSEIGGESLEDMLICNRCGPDEEELTVEEVIQRFIVDRPQNAVTEKSDADQLRTLAEKLRHVPGTYDIDDGDIDFLIQLARELDQ